ncbi:integrase catalytic domain-containing protein [Trichonephila clavipes]|nr:integrase catalytic domain-containing protein [Trichonephila clavipes]
MKLKSPTGRLARWALQLQFFNLNMEYIPGKSNVVADMLSRPACHEENELCEVCTVAIDVPSRSPKEIRDEQMKDEELVKIISCLEDPDKNVNYVNWVERGYLMNQGVLFRYAPDSESEEAKLVIHSDERTLILKDHHDSPMAGHYGAVGTYTRIAKNYYWTGMRKYITDYVKNCPETALNTKLQIRSLSDYYRHLCQPNVLKPCPLISSGPYLRVKMGSETPRLAILVQDKHDCWSEKLPFIRFALNTSKCETTGQTAAFLNFGRELRTPSEVVNDIRVVIQNDNFVPEITPYLKKFSKFSTQIREVVEEQQDSRKFYADKKRKPAPTYQPGEHVFVASHPLSNTAQGRSAKLSLRDFNTKIIISLRDC